jgi:hypothetical protein
MDPCRTNAKRWMPHRSRTIARARFFDKGFLMSAVTIQRPPFALGKIRHEIVRLPKPGMIRPMHQQKLLWEIRKVIPSTMWR